MYKGGEIDWGDGEIVDEIIPSEDAIVIADDAFTGAITVEETGVYIPVDGIAKYNDALTLLEYHDTRNSIYHDIIRVSVGG